MDTVGKAAGPWSWPRTSTVPRLRMREVIPTLPNTSSWCGAWLNAGTTSLLPYPASGSRFDPGPLSVNHLPVTSDCFITHPATIQTNRVVTCEQGWDFVKCLTCGLHNDREHFAQLHARLYPKVSWLAGWSENYKWYSSLPLGAVLSLFCESV
jgi:hypothetical protein